jgi:hypothetical protein
MYFAPYRFYSPEIARFVSVSPYTRDIEHTYGYAKDDPINFVDPNGRYPYYYGPYYTPGNLTEYEALLYHNSSNEDLLKLWRCRRRAFNAAENSGLNGAHNGLQDAYRHCVWQCCVANELGNAAARAWGYAHESFPDNPSRERDMDMHNNAVGRDLAGDCGSCEGKCKKAINNGRLNTL